MKRSIWLAWTAFAPVFAQPVSLVSVYDVEKKSVEVVARLQGVYEAPNWSPDGSYLLINGQGKLWKLALQDKAVKEVPSGLTGCNNDHGISPDGKWIVASAKGESGKSEIYVLPAEGGRARLVTKLAPSYFHGWSPDGEWLAFVGQRENNFDLYRIRAAGGEEERLTGHPAFDDGPDYSPDGRWIYWNTDRSGDYDIWRLPASGGEQRAERITSDEMNDWFPHLSPDAKWIVMVSFAAGTKGHPANQSVVLRMMRNGGKAAPETIVKLHGGQGTMNVNSWAPDSKRFAFVQYEGDR